MKALDIKDADAAGQQLIFANSYHLMLQPGGDIIEAAGGIHKFMHRATGPIITDSGGFQIFSLAYGSVHADVGELSKLKKATAAPSDAPSELKRARQRSEGTSSVVKVTEEGVLFRSYRDGRKILLTPETTGE
jgi:queuine tRNA-ribosyltransferase